METYGYSTLPLQSNMVSLKLIIDNYYIIVKS